MFSRVIVEHNPVDGLGGWDKGRAEISDGSLTVLTWFCEQARLLVKRFRVLTWSGLHPHRQCSVIMPSLHV